MAAPTTPESIKALVAEARKVHKQHQDEKLALQNEQLALQTAWNNERAQLLQQLRNALDENNKSQTIAPKGPLFQFISTNQNSPRKALSNLSTNIPSSSGARPSSQKSPFKQSNTISSQRDLSKAHKRLQKKYDALVKDAESKQATYDRAKTEWRKFKAAVATLIDEDPTIKIKLRAALKAGSEALISAGEGGNELLPDSTAVTASFSKARDSREGEVSKSPRKTAQQGGSGQHVSPKRPSPSRSSFLFTRADQNDAQEDDNASLPATPTKKSKKPLSSSVQPNAVSQQKTPERSSQQHMQNFIKTRSSRNKVAKSPAKQEPLTGDQEMADATEIQKEIASAAKDNEDVEMEEDEDIYPPFNSSQIGNFEENISLAERYASQDRRSKKRIKELEDEQAAEEWEDIPDFLVEGEEEAFKAREWDRQNEQDGEEVEDDGNETKMEVQLRSGLPYLYPLPKAEYYTPPPEQTIIEESLLLQPPKARKRRSHSAKQLSKAFLDIDQQENNAKLAKTLTKFEEKNGEEEQVSSTGKILQTSPKSREKFRKISELAENVKASENTFLARASSKAFWEEKNKTSSNADESAIMPTASSPLRSVKGKQATSPSRAEKQKAKNAVLGLLQDSSSQRSKSILRGKELEKKRDEERERERSGSADPEGNEDDADRRGDAATKEWKGFTKRAQPLPQLSTQAFKAIQANTSRDAEMDLDEAENKELGEDNQDGEESDKTTQKTALSLKPPSAPRALPKSSATITSSDLPPPSQKRASKPLFRPSSTSSEPPPWRAGEAFKPPSRQSSFDEVELPEIPKLSQPPSSILKNKSVPSTQSSSPSQSQPSQSQKKNVTFNLPSPPPARRRVPEREEEPTVEKANIYGKSKILDFEPRPKEQPFNNAMQHKGPSTAMQAVDDPEDRTTTSKESSAVAPKVAVSARSPAWLQALSASTSGEINPGTPINRVSGVSGSVLGTPSVVSRKNSALSKVLGPLGPEVGGSAQPRRIAELRGVKAEITTPKVKESDSQREAALSAIQQRDESKPLSAPKSDSKPSKKVSSSSRKPEALSANKRSVAAANLSDREDSPRGASSTAKGPKKKRPRASDLPEEVEADLSTVGMAIMRNLNTPSALNRRDRESTPLAESSSKSRKPRPINMQKLIDKEEQNRLLKVKMENDRRAAIGRNGSDSSATSRKRSAETAGEEGGSSKKRKKSKESTDSPKQVLKKEEEEEQAEESSEEHKGERYMREIHRKRREELRENPLKYKGNGAYQKQMPKSDEAPETNGQVPYKEVVRNKEARRQMHGFDCDCCNGYYEASTRHLPLEQRRAAAIEMAQKNSRHRELLAPPTTPPGFWEFAFPESQQVERLNAEGKAMQEARKKEKMAAADEAADGCPERFDYNPW